MRVINVEENDAGDREGVEEEGEEEQGVAMFLRTRFDPIDPTFVPTVKTKLCFSIDVQRDTLTNERNRSREAIERE